MQLTCTCEAKCYCIICICIEILLISIETGETVFAYNKFTSLFVRSAHTYMWYEEQNLKQMIKLYNPGCVSGS